MFWKDSETSNPFLLRKLSGQPVLFIICSLTSHKHRRAWKTEVDNLQLFPSKRQNFPAIVKASRRKFWKYFDVQHFYQKAFFFLASISILESINKELISCKIMIIISSDFISKSIMKLDFHSQYKLNKQQLVSEVVLNFLLAQKFKSIKIIREKGLGNKYQYYPSEFIKNKHWILSSLIITTQNGRACDSSGKVQQTSWGDGCLCLFCSPASLTAQASFWSLLVQTGPEPRHLSLHLGPTPAWLRTGPAKNWSSLGEMIVISYRAKSVVGKTSSCLWALCISLPAAGLHGRSLQILFGIDSGQQLLGKWQEVPSSLNCSFSLWYVFPPVFPFSCCTLFLRRDVGLDKTSPPLPKLLLLLPGLRSVSPLLLSWLLCYKEAGALCCQGRGGAEGARSPF